MKYLLLIGYLMWPALSQARLGETLSQCEAHYGPTVGTNSEGIVKFETPRLIVRAWFDSSNRVEKIDYESKLHPLTSPEVQTLLQAESAEEWTTQATEAAQVFWHHAAKARCTALDNGWNLTVSFDALKKRNETRYNSKIPDDLRGF